MKKKKKSLMKIQKIYQKQNAKYIIAWDQFIQQLKIIKWL